MKYQEKCFEKDIDLDSRLTLMSPCFSRLRQIFLRTTTRQFLKTGILRL